MNESFSQVRQPAALAGLPPGVLGRRLGDHGVPDPAVTTVVTVACYIGASLRDQIVHDGRLERYGLEVAKQKAPGRNPGWAKLHANDYDTAGAINLEWNAGTG